MYANTPLYRFAYVAVYVLQFVLLTQIFKKEGRDLDPYLRKTALSAFLIAIVFSVCINVQRVKDEKLRSKPNFKVVDKIPHYELE